jgi:aminoglycoside 2'-N-acetyltransferase I
MDAAFAGKFTEDDWSHTVGGVHALAWEGDELIGHASVVGRRLWHAGRELSCGYVEGVGVGADHRRRGVGDALMAELERVIRADYDLGARSATDAGAALYSARGWRRWEGPLFVRAPAGLQRTAGDDGSVYVLGDLDVAGELTCDWRAGDVW